MEKYFFEILIKASREKIWDVLWNDRTYREWASVFAEGSMAKTDWKKGSRALFLDEKGDGMVSIIADNISNEYMSIKHLGTLIKGVEDTESDKVKDWHGVMENYTLKTVDDGTQLTVDMDMNEEFKDYFIKTWPKALDKVKEIAERK